MIDKVRYYSESKKYLTVIQVNELRCVTASYVVSKKANSKRLATVTHLRF